MTTMRIDAIDADGRHRTDLGDVRSLAESIERVGLLHPVVVTSGGRLVAGGRRLAALAALGRDEVPVTITDSLVDARAQLQAERDENTCRLDMKPSEKVALGLALEELERPKAAERKSASLKQNREENFSSRCERTGKVYDLVGEAVGMSGPTYKRAKAVVEAAQNGEPGAAEALEAMDSTGKVTPAYDRIARSREPRKQRAPAIDSLDTKRGQQRAKAHRRRVVEIVAQVSGLAAGSEHIQIEAALATFDTSELADLTRQLGRAITSLKTLKRELERNHA